MSGKRARLWICGITVLLLSLCVVAIFFVFGRWQSVFLDEHCYRFRKTDRAIFDAVYAGDAVKIRELILRGGNANADIWVDLNGREKLIHWASLRGRIEVVRALLAGGADPNATDEFSRTPLMRMARMPIQNGYDECTVLLVRAGANLEQTTFREGYTALHISALFGNTSYALVLVGLRANVNALQYSRRTPLHLTCDIPFEPPSESMIRLLVEHGADISLRDQNGETASDILKKRNLGHLEYLLNATAGGRL